MNVDEAEKYQASQAGRINAKIQDLHKKIAKGGNPADINVAKAELAKAKEMLKKALGRK